MALNAIPWMQVDVVEIRHGASYAGKIYDQDLIVRTNSGELLTLFDMTPMIAEGIQLNKTIEVIVAVAAPANLILAPAADRQKESGRVEALGKMELNDKDVRCRTLLLRRDWCFVQRSGKHFLLPIEEIKSSSKPKIGDELSWDDGRFDLMAWKKLGTD